MISLPLTKATLVGGAVLGCLAHGAALAQSAQQSSVSVEVESDRRERGLSWSDGKAAASIAAYIPATDSLSLDVDAVTMRDSARHGGSETAITAVPRLALTQSAWNLGVGARGHLFLGRTGLSYVELTGDLDHTIGPVRLGLEAAFAPSQAAVGGENLYLSGRAEGGIPGTPLTVYGGAGHTSGPDRRARATRLRPGGNYFDYLLGVEYSRAALSLGLRYSDIHRQTRGGSHFLLFRSSLWCPRGCVPSAHALNRTSFEHAGAIPLYRQRSCGFRVAAPDEPNIAARLASTPHGH